MEDKEQIKIKRKKRITIHNIVGMMLGLFLAGLILEIMRQSGIFLGAIPSVLVVAFCYWMVKNISEGITKMIKNSGRRRTRNNIKR